MDLNALFNALERAGAKTFGQAKSVLMSAGVDPVGVHCNHATIDEAVKGLTPASMIIDLDDTPAPLGIFPTAEQIVAAMRPELEHLVEGVEARLHDLVAHHVDKVGESIGKALIGDEEAELATTSPTVG